MASLPAGSMADVVEEEKVKELCPEEYEAFISSLRADEQYLEDEVDDGADAKDRDILKHVITEALMWEGPLERQLPQPIIDAWTALVAKFAEVTRDEYANGGTSPGLTLGIAHHNSEDEGSGYDEVNGIFWWVDGMYELTPAGVKCRDFVERKHYVQYG